MDHLLVIWLARVGSGLLALGAGWLFGRSVPSWEADQLADESEPRPRGRFGLGLRPSHSYGSGGSVGFNLTAGRPGWGSAAALGALVLAFFGFDAAHSFSFEVTTAALTLGLGAAAGYLAAVFTDKGPVGPLE